MIPPSAAKGTQMTVSDVSTSNKFANARIFVEKAIDWIKWFQILFTGKRTSECSGTSECQVLN